MAMMLPAFITAVCILTFTHGSLLARDDGFRMGMMPPDQSQPRGPVTPICVYYNNCSETEVGPDKVPGEEAGVPTARAPCRKDFVVETKMKVNWFQAWNICAQRGQTLATVANQDEEQLLTAGITGAGSLTDVWIGATDLAERGHFHWMVSGKPLTYANWYPGHPKVRKGGFEPCVSAFKGHSGYRWLNLNCYFPRYFACEICVPEVDYYNIDIRGDEAFGA